MENSHDKRGYTAGSVAAPYVIVKSSFSVKLQGDMFTQNCEIMLPFSPDNLFPTDEEYKENMKRAQRLVDSHIQEQYNALLGESDGQ